MKDQLEDLVAEMHGSGILYSEAVREFKKKFILQVLQGCKGNQCRAARELGMHRNTLSRTLAELKIEAWRYRDAGRNTPPAFRAERKPRGSIGQQAEAKVS